MIPSEIKWDPNATPPQFTNNEDMVIEKGTQVRVKIIGIRSEVGEMWAIGSIKEDYLGYVASAFRAPLEIDSQRCFLHDVLLAQRRPSTFLG